MLFLSIILLHILAYTVFPTCFISWMSSQTVDSLYWVCCIWMLIFQFHIWCVWLDKDNSLGSYVPAYVHFMVNTALNLLCYIIHSTFLRGLMIFQIVSVIIDIIAITNKEIDEKKITQTVTMTQSPPKKKCRKED